MKINKIIGIVFLILFSLISNINATTYFEDDFNTGSIDLTKWDKLGTTDCFSQNGSVLKGSGSVGWTCSLASDTTYSRIANNEAIFTTYLDTTGGNNDVVGMVGFHDSGTGGSYTDLVYATFLEAGSSSFKIYEDGNLRGTGTSDVTFLNTWVNIKIILKTSGADYYIKRTIDSSWTLMYNSSYSTESNLKIAYADSSSGTPNFKSDEIKYWSGSTTPLNPTINFDTINLTNNSFINSNSISIFTNITTTYTNNNTYFNYTLDNNNPVTYGSLVLNATANLTVLSEGLHNISFYAYNNETNIISPRYYFTIDTIDPIINNNILSNYSSYTINLNSSCSDPNLLSCNISIDGQNVLLNSSSITLTHNGNISYIITASDLAGNTASTNGTIFINPYQYFRFYDTARALNIINFTFGNYNSSDQYIKIPLYDLGLGNQSLLFSKFGYTQENFQFNFNLTSALNQTFNSTPITLTIKVYDEKSPSTQLNFNLSLNNVLNYTQYLNQLNFQKYYNETLTGNLTLTIESSGFSLRKVFTELSPYSAVSHVIYLLSDIDSTPVIFRTLNLAQTQAISDVVFTFKKEINGVPTFLGQAKTDSQGYTFFNMDVLSSYEITISKNGYISQIINSIPGKTDYIILMQESGTTNSYLYDDFSYLITPKSISSFPFNVSTTVFDQANLISSMRFTVTGDNTSFTNVLTASSGGSIQFEITNQSSRYILNLTVMREGKEYSYINKLNYYPTTATNTTVKKVATELKGTSNNEDRVFMMIILYIVAIVLGSIFSPAAGAVMGLFPITIFAYVEWMSVGIAALFYLITILGVLYFER